MMLSHPNMEAVFDFADRRVNTLVIENPAFFRKLAKDIAAQIEGCAGDTVLSRNNMPISFAANAEMIDSLLSFQIGRKSLVNKIIARMEAAAVSEVNYLRTAQLMSELEKYVHFLSFDLPCDVFCSKLSIGAVLKAVGVDIPDDYESDLERLLDYMDLTRELERDKLFIFVNLRSYYGDSEIQHFFSSVLSHEYQVLCLDSVSRELLPNEHRITVDNDLCEF